MSDDIEDIAAAIVGKNGVKDPEPQSPAGRPWPELGKGALYGLPGTIINTILPHSEASAAAMLFTLYAGAGAMIGRTPHMFVGGTEHGARVWPLIIGATAGGMKGTSWSEIKQVLKEADDKFCGTRIMGGLSSAEGLIFQVRDSTGDPEDEHFDEGVSDKRLLVVESEFASVLAQGKRDGNTLLPIVRQAWDGDTLRTMTIRPRVATDPHIVVIGHVTPTELRAKLSESERAGGTMNRYLPVMSKRSKRLPDGGMLEQADIKALGAQLAERIAAAASVKRMQRTLEAAKYWREIYPRLTPDHIGDGPVAQVVARAAPQVLRLSVTAALLDGEDRIGLEHLQAAEALWAYAEDSAWYIFGTGSGNPDFDRLKGFVDAAGDGGVTRTEITKGCFGGHRKKADLDALVGELLKIDGYEMYSQETGGRPVLTLRRTKQK
ncbi:DUF3987 domain-containing protein [Streptacidiphilus sp. PAMC 29251]